MKVHGSLVFYIGNGTVKGGIAAYEEGKPPRIVTSRSRDLPYHADRTREHLEKRIIHEFAELLRDMKKGDVTEPAAREVKIQGALIIFSSPWYVSETSVIKMKEQNEFVVTDKLLETSKENIIKAYRDANEVDVMVLEQQILRVSLNGYQTANPVKKKAHALDMVIFTSFAKNSSVGEFKRLLDQNFHLPQIRVHSQSLATFSAISKLWKNTGQYIIADITSELTELVAVRNDALAEAASFPKGKKHLVQAVATALGVTEEVAVSFLAGKEQGALEPTLVKKIDACLESAKKEWLKNFTAALSQMSSGSSLPKKFFLFAPKEVVSIFANFITSESYQQFSFAEGVFEVKAVSAFDFKDICISERGASPDLALVIAAMFN